jgi:DNA-binding NarL/FixJ family response regulator
MVRSRLIIADDHQTVLDTVRLILEPEFDIVSTVPDGLALLSEVARVDPDLVLLDITMPGLNGLEVARQLRNHAARCKVVFLTVHEDEDYVREALAAGAIGYVVKSRMAVDLATAVRSALAGRKFISAGPKTKNGVSENYIIPRPGTQNGEGQ